MPYVHATDPWKREQQKYIIGAYYRRKHQEVRDAIMRDPFDPPRPVMTRSEIIAVFERRKFVPLPPTIPTDMDTTNAMTPRNVAATSNGTISGIALDVGFGSFNLSLSLAQAQTIADGLIKAASVRALKAELARRGFALPSTVGPKASLLSGPSSPWRIVEYDSSAIKRTAYSAGTRELYILFVPGRNETRPRIQRYVEVNVEIARVLETATSVGAAYNEVIKGQFPSINATTFPSGTA